MLKNAFKCSSILQIWHESPIRLSKNTPVKNWECINIYRIWYNEISKNKHNMEKR